MRFLLLITLLIMFCSLVNYGQISYKGKPMFYDNLKYEIPIEVLPEVNVKKLEREDKRLNSRLKTLRFAEILEVEFSPETHGVWNNLKKERVWYLTIKSPGAYSLSIVFGQFRLPMGAKLFVYSADKQHMRGAFTYKNNKQSNKLPLAPIKGDEIIIEYHEPFNVEFKGELLISAIGHDYKNIFNYLTKEEKGFGDSGDCNVNINCDDDELWQLLKYSVCKITYNGYLCSGALINNTKENGYPYLLTANHCISIPYEAENAVFYFNYESPGCQNEDGQQGQTISGSTIIATPPEKTLDFSLLELSEPPPPEYKPYYAGWSRDISNPSSVTSIHHPRGDIKKITKSYDGATTGDYGEGYEEYKHWWIDEWNEGTTEGGSSGSPLFDQNGRIIGDLTGGDAYCDYNFNDYYQKIYHSWQDFSSSNYQLKPWLDPLNSGVVSLNGYLPYDTIPSNLKASLTDTIVNLQWNHVSDTSNIDFYYIYRNSSKIDSVKDVEYSDTLAFKGVLYKYYITAKYNNPKEYESLPSNVVFIRSMNAISLPFSELFEDGFIPDDWYEERSNDTVGWQFKAGGFDGVLDTAFEGSLNTYFFNDNSETSKLVLPKFDFSAYTNLKLSFYMHMQEFNNDVHRLNILYSEADSLDWKVLKSYNTNIETWEKKEISLRNLSNNYKIAFEGIGYRGFGICIDSVSITEDGDFLEPDIQVNKDTICVYDSIRFSTTLDDSYNFSWDFGNGAIPETAVGEGPHWVKYNDIGIKSVTLTVNDIYVNEDYDIAVVYESSEIPSFTNNGNTLISSAEYGNQWYLDGAQIEDATGNTFEIEEDGRYFVEVTNSFNCVSISEEKYMIVDDISEIDEEIQINGIRIYPNPNNGQFTIQTEILETGVYYYKIVDVAGRLLQTGELEQGLNNHEIKIKTENEGIFFIQINNGIDNYTSKIVIKK